jgi:cytochrome c peroxidase
MRKPNILWIGIFLIVVAFGAGCSKEKAPATSEVKVNEAMLKMFQPLPEMIASASNPVTPEKVALGRMLYYEARLSKSQKISCNSCHMLDKYGVDGQPTSDGHRGQKGERNAPTVYLAAGHFLQFWDGRAPDVEEQAKGPMMNPVEMAMSSEKQVIAVLKSMPEYVDAFKRAFPGEKDPVTFNNVAFSIGAFERELVTPSRWDKYLKGDQNALTAEEKAGFNTYVNAGCAMCHSGMYVGGALFQKLGAAKPWPDTSDPGREKVTKKEADRQIFKVPSLRNIEKTGPYYHNGKVAELQEAVSKMGEYQLGKTLTDAQVKAIVTWLNSLTGDLPTEYIKEPPLPKSTNATPKPVETD